MFKKIRLYNSFKKILRSNKVPLEGNFNARIDKVYRIYTVINIPEETFGEPYNVRKSDIDSISETYIKEYVSKISNYLNSVGLSELYDFYEPIKKVDKYSYLIVLGFKPFNSVNYNNLIWFRIVPILSIVSIISLIIYFFFK
jgi:hypothetical protein